METTHPWLTPRWNPIAGEAYGRGPPLDALADILTLNKVVEFNLQAAAYAIAGVYTVADDGVTNPSNWQIKPGVFVPVARNEGHPSGPSLASLENGSRFDVTQIEIERLQGAIKRAYYDQSLPPEAGPVRSPTEMLLRQKELSQDLGAAFSPIVREFIVPLVLRGLQILSDLKMIEYPIVISATTIKVIPVSPLAQTQNLNNVETSVRWLELCQMMGPEIAMLGVMVEDMPAYWATELGVDAKLVRPAVDRQKLQQVVAKLLAAQMQPQGAPAAPGAQPQNGATVQ